MQIQNAAHVVEMFVKNYIYVELQIQNAAV